MDASETSEPLRMESDSDACHDQPEPFPLMSPRARRVVALAVLLLSTGILGIAGWLRPDVRGYGTHQQLRLGPCGMLLVTGYPCPTCGMTTAFAYAVRGNLWRSFLAQPAGVVLALATVAAALGSLWVLVAGRFPPIRMPLVTPYRLCAILIVLLLGGWGLKILFMSLGAR